MKEKSYGLALSLLRIALGLILIFQAISIAPSLYDFYGEFGIMQSAISDYLATGSFVPSMSSVQNTLSWFHLHRDEVVTLIFYLYLIACAFFTIGLYTSLASVMTFLLHLILLSSNRASTYGVDHYLHFALFYYIFPGVGRLLSFDEGLKLREDHKNVMNSLVLKWMKIHFALTYFAAGLGKISGEQWRGGEAIWRSLMLPEYQFYDFSFLSQYHFVGLFLCWWTMVIELFYPLFMLMNRKVALLCLSQVILMHLGIIVFMKLYYFGLVMIVLNLFLFVLREKDILHFMEKKTKDPGVLGLIARKHLV